ncbi:MULTISPECIES: SAM-dependent methyltransferase [Catenuloplanes]|uniref:Uncharacterized protein n=1 Tax=Catenuloplanes niger TaxID=587534 RepID=A0AAE3ZR08_9ACTN|nr:SAM-dependent methyltransferase [Catenuloplanes niger]MDR7322658.1 hypothetical protein [Catenuloplanes niger]
MLYDTVSVAAGTTVAHSIMGTRGGAGVYQHDSVTPEAAVADWIECAVLLAGRGLQISQFLCVDAGLITEPAVHDLARVVARDVRVTYTDHVRNVAAVGGLQLSGEDPGQVRYLHANPATSDVHAFDPAWDVLDPDRPVAVIVPPRAGQRGPRTYQVMRQLVAGLPSGSLLALAAATTDRPACAERGRGEAVTPSGDYSLDQVHRLFDGLDLLGPGVLPVWRWTCGPRAGRATLAWAGLGRRP